MMLTLQVLDWLADRCIRAAMGARSSQAAAAWAALAEYYCDLAEVLRETPPPGVALAMVLEAA